MISPFADFAYRAMSALRTLPGKSRGLQLLRVSGKNRDVSRAQGLHFILVKQRHTVWRSLAASGDLNDDPRGSRHPNPTLLLKYDALNRQFDHVGHTHLGVSTGLEFDKHQFAIEFVSTIQSGDQSSDLGRERLLGVHQSRTAQLTRQSTSIGSADKEKGGNGTDRQENREQIRCHADAAFSSGVATPTRPRPR